MKVADNLGIAIMNQQRMEAAVEKFDLALKADPSLSTAELNKGIALLNLQKLNEAEEALKHVAAAQPRSPRVWYNLGLLHRGQGKSEDGIEDFKKVIALDARDADAHYFVGQFYLQMQKYDDAVPYFEAALKLNRLHVSAEFGLARALQRSGKVDEARVHLKIFDHLTREKIASPMTLAYGDQGPYSMAEDIHDAGPSVEPMIPITMTGKLLWGWPISGDNFVSPDATVVGPHNFGTWKKQNEPVPQLPQPSTLPRGGVCMIDVDGDGKPDIIVLSSGENALTVLINKGNGEFKPVLSAQFGLALKGNAISCAVGDYDNDDKPDLAVARSDRIVLFKNQGNGKFTDVTAAAGISASALSMVTGSVL